MSVIEKIFGTHSDKELKKIYPIVDKIEALDESMQALSDEELKAKTPEFKARLEKGETLDDLLPEAFAVVREAADRVLHMKHYRVQLIGGILLGIIENLSKAYISSQMADAIVFAVLIIVLLVRPTGILGKNIQEKV